MKKLTERAEIEQLQSTLVAHIPNDWALVTAGNIDSFNTMTVAWASLGDIWWKPVFNAWVKPSRYTYEFIGREEFFTVQFFGPEHKDDLVILGTKSGRDCDKVAETGLTPMDIDGKVTFEQALVTLVCRKLYSQPLDFAGLPEDVVNQYYQDGEVHTHFIGEIVEAYVKE